MKVGIETGTIYEDTDSVKTKQELNAKYGMTVQYESIMNRANNTYDKLPDYMQRVVIEARELSIKRHKLYMYIAKEKTCHATRLKELDLMRRQLNSMEQYLDCLLQRLDMYV